MGRETPVGGIGEAVWGYVKRFPRHLARGGEGVAGLSGEELEGESSGSFPQEDSPLQHPSEEGL